MVKKKSKRAIWGIILMFMVITVVIMFFYAIYEWWQARRSHMVRYPEFGIEIPINYAIHGIDVSKYQNIIDWQSVRAMNIDEIKIGFAFIKATEGLGNEDAFFSRNWPTALRLPMPEGPRTKRL